MGVDLFEGQRDEARRRVGVRQAIVLLGRSGEMGICRTELVRVWSLATSKSRMAVR